MITKILFKHKINSYIQVIFLHICVILTYIALRFHIHMKTYWVLPIILLQFGLVFPYESKIAIQSNLKKRK